MSTLRSVRYLHILAAGACAGQFGLLKGAGAGRAGLREGKLKPPSRTENSVTAKPSSGRKASMRQVRCNPTLAFTQDSALAMNRLRKCSQAGPGARCEATPEYLSVQFETRWLRFVDDAEFLFDPGARIIHVRSASRLGRKDFGANRARIEAIRRRADLR